MTLGVHDSDQTHGTPGQDLGSHTWTFRILGNPGISTEQSAGGAIGTVIHDTANVTGGDNPTGNVTFNLYGPDQPECTGDPVFSSTNALSADAATSGTFPTTTVGTYRWRAKYNRDAHNNPATSGCNDEQVVIGKATPEISTTPSATLQVVGAVLSDSATVSGGSSPSGSVTFNLYGPGAPACTGALPFTDTEALVAGAAQSKTHATDSAGTWRWTATYSGDASNVSVASGCQAEQQTLGKVSPTISTTPSKTSVTLGDAISDKATVAGGFNPTGNVVFNLYSPSDATCSGSPAYTSTAALAGDGTATSGSFTTAATGTYRWTATYAGDGNNSSAVSGCQDEQVAVGTGNVQGCSTTTSSAGSTGSSAANGCGTQSTLGASITQPNTGQSELARGLMVSLVLVLMGAVLILAEVLYGRERRTA